MSFEISIDSKSQKVLLKSKQVKQLTDKAIRQAFQRIGKDLKQDANQEMLKKPKHGRLYRIKLRGRMINHRASAENESPAVITNKLRKSVGYTLNGTSQMSFGAGNNADVNYALPLEVGAPQRKLAGRKYLERSIKNRQGNIRRNFEQQIAENLKS